ncbi:hypothetical protein ACFL35_01450 [Candidatus Riflebacteria bacterium]
MAKESIYPYFKDFCDFDDAKRIFSNIQKQNDSVASKKVISGLILFLHIPFLIAFTYNVHEAYQDSRSLGAIEATLFSNPKFYLPVGLILFSSFLFFILAYHYCKAIYIDPSRIEGIIGFLKFLKWKYSFDSSFFIEFSGSTILNDKYRKPKKVDGKEIILPYERVWLSLKQAKIQDIEFELELKETATIVSIPRKVEFMKREEGSSTLHNCDYILLTLYLPEKKLEEVLPGKPEKLFFPLKAMGHYFSTKKFEVEDGTLCLTFEGLLRETPLLGMGENPDSKKELQLNLALQQIFDKFFNS